MPLMNVKLCEECLRNINLGVYMFGKRLENPTDGLTIRPAVNAVWFRAVHFVH